MAMIRLGRAPEFEGFGDGFRVKTLLRKTEVRFEPWGFVMSGHGSKEKLGLVETVGVVRRIVSQIPWSLEGDEQFRPPGRDGQPLPRHLTAALGSFCELLAREAPPRVIEVQKTVFDATGQTGELAIGTALYDDPWLADDVLRFRAAAIAVGCLPTLLREHRLPPYENLLEHARNWRGLFSPDLRPYRSLNRTLDALPEGIALHHLTSLTKIRLERPVTNPIELRAVLLRATARLRAHQNATRENQDHVFLHATEAEIRESLRILSRALGRRYLAGSTSSLRDLVSYLADYPHIYDGRLPGLTRRAVEWHESFVSDCSLVAFPDWARRPRRRAEPAVPDTHLHPLPPSLDDATPTARPPIPLPEDAGIRFLATVGEMRAEGELMGHCVANYDDSAVAGVSYFFHVEHNRQHATVEVDAAIGRVTQAKGPRNHANAATRWGKTRLSRWASDFPCRRERSQAA